MRPATTEPADSALVVPTVLAAGTAQTATATAPLPAVTPDVQTAEPAATPESAVTPTDEETLARLIPPLPDGYRPANSLLFISDGWLQRWSAADGAVTRLIGPQTGADSALGAVVSFQTDSAGQRIAAVRRTSVVPEQFELLTLTVDNPTPQVIARNLLEIRSYRVSPDGTQIAYTPVVPLAPDVDTLLAPLTIYVAPAAGGTSRPVEQCTQAPAASADPKESGIYSGLCGGLIWTLDSQHLIWRDGDGLRTRGLEATVTYTLLANSYAPPVDEGPSIYEPQAWAPSGRYLLLEVGGWESSTQAIYDFRDQRLLPVPHVRFIIGYPQVLMSWMADDRIFMVRQQEAESEVMAEIYRIPDSGNALVLEESTWLGQAGTTIVAPQQHSDGRFGVTLWRRDGLGQSALLTLTSLAEPQRGFLPLYTWPGVGFLPNWVRWNGAGTAALIALPAADGSGVRPMLADVAGEQAYDAENLLGQTLQQAQWLP